MLLVGNIVLVPRVVKNSKGVSSGRIFCIDKPYSQGYTIFPIQQIAGPLAQLVRAPGS